MIIEKLKVSDHVEIEYSLSGPDSEYTLLFVHGLGSNLNQFVPQQQHFAKNGKVLLISLRGHGNSSAPINPSQADYTVRKMARDVQALLQHLGIKKVHFVGNSLGGMVGYELLTLDLDLLESLTTFGTTPRLHVSRVFQWSLLRVIRLLGSKGMGWVVSKTGSKNKAVGAKLNKMYKTVSKDALELITENVADYDYTDMISKNKIPMMLIRGSLDTEINKNLDTTLDVLREKTDFELVELPGAGHFANMDVPDDFNETLARFLVKQSIRSNL